MFDALAKGFRNAKNRLAGLQELDAKNIEPALREVRLSLLEADVDLGVTKGFLAAVKEKALGQTVQVQVKHGGATHKVTAGDQFVKICHDELVARMEHGGAAIHWAEKGPTGIMMVGLQGSGKTTSCAKLARLLQKDGKKVLLVAADMQRPAAVEQLKILGQQIDVPVFAMPPPAKPVDITKLGWDEAKKLGLDVVVFDTAGRLAIDEVLMEELGAIKETVQPNDIFFVVDAMIGQDAVKTARAFHDKLAFTGVVMTKLDGDARGGAALSVKTITGAPLVFVGVGEQTDKFEEFRADGMASRILGMGDVVGLMKDFEDVIDQKQAEQDAMRMLQGEFTLDDFLNQVRTIKSMGPLNELVDKMPGMAGMIPQGTNLDDKELDKVEAIICSMTKQEKRDAYVLVREPERVQRIAKGSARKPEEVQGLVQQFMMMKQMMDAMSQQGGMLNSLLGALPGGKQIQMARAMKKMAGQGGMPGFPGMGGMPGMPGMGMPFGMPGMGMPGMGGAPKPSLTKMKTLSEAERNAKKRQRKAERDARKKARK